MIRDRIKALLLSPSPPLFAALWPLLALFLYLSFLGDAGYLTYRARKTELHQIDRSLEELRAEYRNLNDRFLYGGASETQPSRTEEIFLFKFENLPPALPTVTEAPMDRARLFFLFAASFVELVAIAAYAHRRKTPASP